MKNKSQKKENTKAYRIVDIKFDELFDSSFDDELAAFLDEDEELDDDPDYEDELQGMDDPFGENYHSYDLNDYDLNLDDVESDYYEAEEQ